MSVRWLAESFTRLACVINTTFREKIYIRWCCIDRLSSQVLSECGPSYLKAKKPVNGMVRRRTLEVVECGARRHLMKIYALGIDLGKTVFHLVGLDASGQVVVPK